ncbi:RFC3_5 [Mytilus edulis]|uniref:RFC3_5 n=1 Tax=Mytilus edulis TaxID=6550 RepID=A0A8S3U8I3_MYTED|nr:RFC3_5 [Mytilus edulis]
MVLTEKDRINRTQWERMFQVSELPCIQHRSYFPNGYILNPCSTSATIGIRHSDLDGRARMIILSKFCTLMKHIDKLVNTRNTAYAHAIKGELSDEDFSQLWIEIQNSIIYVSNITSTADSRKLCILELREKSLEESMCLELQFLILKQMHGDELFSRFFYIACRKLQDTVGMAKESIDLKLQQIELQIAAFTSSMSDVVKNELSIKMNEYSVATATELLDSNNLLILFGRAGSGKTSTALAIASLFHANGYIIMKLEQNLAKDFKTYFISKNKQLVIFEDLFGKADIRYNEDIHSNLLNVLKPHVFNGVSKFIITVRSYKSEIDYEIATYHQLLSKGGVIGTATNDDWLIQRLIILLKTESSQHGHDGVDSPALTIERYIENYGSEQFVNSFNEKLAEVFQSEDNVMNCEWNVIHYFIRPISFTIVNGQIGTVTNDGWLIQRFINNLTEQESFEHGVDISAGTIERYIKKYECAEFVNSFNEKLAKQFQSEYNVMNCKWDAIDYFIRPNSFKIENGQIGTVTNDDWLLQRLINILMKERLAVDTIDRYIKEYGCEQFVNSFNEKLAEWFQSEKRVENCEWYVINYFIRPKSFTIENGQIGIVTDDYWIKQRLINILMKFDSSAYAVDSLAVKRYIKKYGREQFVNSFNEKLAELFQSKENVMNCDWYVIDYFIRPKCFTIRNNGKIGTVTNDDWLIQRIIYTLVKSESSKHRVDISMETIERYIKKYGCEQFVNSFNKKTCRMVSIRGKCSKL